MHHHKNFDFWQKQKKKNEKFIIVFGIVYKFQDQRINVDGSVASALDGWKAN